MQERFCTCGKMVMVRYNHNVKTASKPQIIITEQKMASVVRVCPNCGSPLDINTLR